MEAVAIHCQAITEQYAGYFIWMEAVRTEAAQTKYQPLQPMMQRRDIIDYARPWKQILAFFVRTRRREEEGPKSRLDIHEAECLAHII